MSQFQHAILIVDDNPVNLKAMSVILAKAGQKRIMTCADSREVMDILARNPIDAVFLDLRMPHVSGQTLLGNITLAYPDIPVIIVTGNHDVKTAVQCMKAGAFDYVLKPVDPDMLGTAVTRALAFRDLKKENLKLKQNLLAEALENPQLFAGIITQDRRMLSIFSYIESVAFTSHPVLITGETGVGKELIARVVHDASVRKGPFVAVNIAGLDDNVFSDTLFGHIKGAFTGADRDRPGMIEKASGGTLFLDEIGEMRPESQVKLLRLLQEHEYFPLGRDEPKTTDVRIVAATNKDLTLLQSTGYFREDLHYRLRTHFIHLPPLREREGDIPLLMDAFLTGASKEMKKKKPEVKKEVFAFLETYSFPGNVRELQAMVYDAVGRLKSKSLTLDAFKAHIARRQDVTGTSTAAAAGFADLLRQVEPLPGIKDGTQLLVAEAMRRTSGNQSAAARMLGISHQAMSKRMKGKESA